MISRPRHAFLSLFAALLASPFAASGAPATPPASTRESRVIKIDPAATQGVWEGWGTSLAWWAKVLGDRDDIADWLFTTRPSVQVEGHTLPGLGMTIARYNAGACSWTEIDGRRMVVSKTIHPFRQIEAYWIDGKNPDPDSASWDWSVDAKQRAMLQKARDRGADRFELFSNSPPWWMCSNDNPSGATKDSVENLPVARRPEFAHYLATIARRAKDHWGITFTTVATFNEPSASYWFANGKQEGSHFPPASQAAILPLVRAALDRQGLADMQLSASDETSYDQALEAWKTYPPEAKVLVSQVNVHGYQGAGGRRDELQRLAHIEDGKRVWNSEYGDKYADGLGMARNFHLDMRWLRPTAWVYWQPLDGGNDGGWGFLDADLFKGKVGRANPKAYVFAQYSRHIRPGMTILAVDDAHTVVAHNAAANRLVIAAFNGDDSSRSLACDLSRFQPGAGSSVARWLTEPMGKTRYQPLPSEPLRGARPTWTLPAKSILTIEISEISVSR